MRKPTLYRHRGAWFARFWDEKAGKYRSRSLGIPVVGKKERRREAEEAAFKMAVDMAVDMAAETARPARPADAPLLAYAENFWKADGEYAREKALLEKKPVSAHYLLMNRRAVETKMKPFHDFAGMGLGALTKPAVRKWQLWLANQGYSGRVINGAMLALRVPVRRAFIDGLIPSDPSAGMPRAAHKEKMRGVLTPAEIKKLAETPAADPRSRLAVYLSLYCSMRMGEVRGLQWGDISGGVIHVFHNWQDGEGLKPCKCGSEGYVPVPQAVAELVNQVREIAPLAGQNDFVLSQRPHHPVSREYLWEALRLELSQIGVDEEERKKRNIVFHSLRHSFVTACRIAGLSDFETMTLSRHKDVKMLQRYSHGKEAIDVKRIGEKLEKSLFNKDS